MLTSAFFSVVNHFSSATYLRIKFHELGTCLLEKENYLQRNLSQRLNAATHKRLFLIVEEIPYCMLFGQINTGFGSIALVSSILSRGQQQVFAF